MDELMKFAKQQDQSTLKWVTNFSGSRMHFLRVSAQPRFDFSGRRARPFGYFKEASELNT
jgi:hypothetical protein